MLQERRLADIGPMPFDNTSYGSQVTTKNLADAEIARHASALTQMQNHDFLYLLVFLVIEFWITEYYDPRRLWHESSQETDLYCNLARSAKVAGWAIYFTVRNFFLFLMISRRQII